MLSWNIFIPMVTHNTITGSVFQIFQKRREDELYTAFFHPFLPNAAFLYPLKASEYHKIF